MINSKFYNQISRCPVCKGWGEIDGTSLKKREECTKCGGRGVFLTWTDNIFFFGAPTYVDYKSRSKIFILKIVIGAIGLLLLWILSSIFVQFIKFLF